MDRVLTKIQSTDPELNRIQDRLLQVLNPVLKRALLVAERYTTATRPPASSGLAGTFIRVRDGLTDEVLQVCLQDDSGNWVWGLTGGPQGEPGADATVAAVQISRSTDQAAEPGDTVAFDTRDVDPGGLQDGATVVIPADGVYRVHAEFTVSDLAASSWARASLDVNGTVIYRGPIVTASPEAGVFLDYMATLARDDVASILVDSSDSAVTVDAGAIFSVVGVPVAS
jgi:hypothetical protein